MRMTCGLDLPHRRGFLLLPTHAYFEVLYSSEKSSVLNEEFRTILKVLLSSHCHAPGGTTAELLHRTVKTINASEIIPTSHTRCGPCVRDIALPDRYDRMAVIQRRMKHIFSERFREAVRRMTDSLCVCIECT